MIFLIFSKMPLAWLFNWAGSIRVFYLFLPLVVFPISRSELCFFVFIDFLALEHMREKRPVTFQMTPKKSKCQMSEKEATMADGWKKLRL